MVMFALLACQSPNDAVDPRVVVDVSTEPVPHVAAVDDETRFGEQVVAGSDLDHDGVLEWATVSMPWDSIEGTYDGIPSVHLYEGTELLDTLDAADDRTVWDQWARSMAAGVDIDGDRYPDLVLTNRRPKEPTELVIQTSLHEQTTLPLDTDEGWWSSATVAMARTEGGGELITSMVVDPTTLRIDRLTDALPDTPWKVSTLPEHGTEASAPLPVDLDGDGLHDHVLLGDHTRRAVDNILSLSGSAQLCALEAATETDCTWLGGGRDRTRIGEVLAAGDLDGDGVAELASTIPGYTQALLVFEADGTALAKIHGPVHTVGHAPLILTDDAGEAWLVFGGGRHGPDTLYGFRGPRVVGTLEVTQADRIWKLPFTNELSIAPYRATDDDPLQLAVGAADQVFLLPFER